MDHLPARQRRDPVPASQGFDLPHHGLSPRLDRVMPAPPGSRGAHSRLSLATRGVTVLGVAIKSFKCKETQALFLGQRKGQHSIRINDQWRVCFVWTEQGPKNVEIVDYH